jgi:hypothetical protein
VGFNRLDRFVLYICQSLSAAHPPIPRFPYGFRPCDDAFSASTTWLEEELGQFKLKIGEHKWGESCILEAYTNFLTRDLLSCLDEVQGSLKSPAERSSAFTQMWVYLDTATTH